MKMPTYKEQFDKLTSAYIADKVKPMQPCACFVGNLLNGTSLWINYRRISSTSIEKEHAIYSVLKESNGLYTIKEVLALEHLFMDTLWEENYNTYRPVTTTTYEDALFKAFEVTLEALKALHISKGEVIDESPVFTQRQLAHENS